MSYSEKMLDALDKEDLAEAQLMFQKALKEDRKDIQQMLAEELMTRGFLEEAQEILIRLTEQSPENKELYLSLAEIAIENDEIDTAFDYLGHIQPEDDCYPESLLVSADLYQITGIPEVSEAKLKEAQSLLPDEPVITFALGELYFSTEKFPEALKYYQELKEQGINELSGVSLDERIGISLNMAGEFEASIPYFEAAVEENTSDDALFQLAFTYFQLKDYQKAIQYFQQLRTFDPHYQSLYLYLAEAYQEEEMLEEAREAIEAGVKENPYQVDMLHFAAENAYRLHDSESSEKHLLQALELGEKQDETLLTLSNLYLDEGRYEEVIATVERMEESGNPYAEWNLAHAYNALEDYATALVHYEQAAEELAHEPDFLKEYGIFLREEGKLSEAKAMLSHYLHHEPGDMEVESILEDLERGDGDVY